jgi:hypothetical protein
VRPRASAVLPPRPLVLREDRSGAILTIRTAQDAIGRAASGRSLLADDPYADATHLRLRHRGNYQIQNRSANSIWIRQPDGASVLLTDDAWFDAKAGQLWMIGRTLFRVLST